MRGVRRLLAWVREPEVLGPPECPLFRRWTIYGSDGLLPRFGWQGKVVIHHFLPNTEDADPHDHPWWFGTLILKGGYMDLVPCHRCDGKRTVIVKNGYSGIMGDTGVEGDVLLRCPRCRGRGVQVGEEMKRGRFRFRRATHRHITKVSTAGAWTFCVMGPKAREWGFWRQCRQWQWQVYEERFGLSFRCDTEGNRVVEVGNPHGRPWGDSAANRLRESL